MLAIVPNELWIGNAIEIRDARHLLDHQVTAVVDLAYEEPPATLPRQLVYCRFPLIDGGGNSKSLLQLALKTTRALFAANNRTVIACSAGRSRSPTIAAHTLATGSLGSPSQQLAQIASQKSLEVNGLFWANVAAAYAELDV